MANFDNIKREIDQNVNTNGVQAITGKILNTTLKDMLQEVDDKKQDTLVAGSGISISGNTISATGGGSGQEYYAGQGISIDPNNTISVNPGEIAGYGLSDSGTGYLNIDGNVIQGKLTPGDHISISGNTISATGFQEPLVSGTNLKTINGNSLLGSGDIVISGGSGGNYLPLEGGTLQNTSTGDTELKVIDGADEDYVKVVASETQGERPHIEIFENGSGDTKIYYDRIEKGSDTIMLPSQSGTLALTSDLAGKQDTLTAGNGINITGNTISTYLDPNTFAYGNDGWVILDYPTVASNMAGNGLTANGPTLDVDTTVIQEKLVSGQNLKTINGNSLLGSGDIQISGGNSYTAGSGISIDSNYQISVNPSDIAGAGLQDDGTGKLEVNGFLPLTGGTLQNTSSPTELNIQSNRNPNNTCVKIYTSSSGEQESYIKISAFESSEMTTKSTTFFNDRLQDKEGHKVYYPTVSSDETLAVVSDLNGKQDTLVSGTNIKTINGNSLLGSGDLVISGGSGQSYVAGNGIDITGNTISVDASDLIGTGLTSDLNGHLNVDPNTLAGNGLRVDSNGALEVVGGGSGSGLWTSGTGSNSLLSVPAQDSTGTASGDYSLSSGFDTDATGSYSVALGYKTTAGGDYSFAAGKQPTASGTSSVALGDLASASGDYSVALGSNANASGTRSFATSNANATNIDSIALGNDATAGTGVRNVAIGTHTLATNNDEVATGKYNKNYTGGTTSENTAFTIGNGSSDSTRSNAVEIKANNDIYVVGVGGFDGTNSASATTLQDAINNGGSSSSYTAGSGIDITGGTISVDTSTIQEKLQAGNNITISGNTISATDTNTTYSAGSGLNLSGTTFSADTTVLQEKLVSGTSIKTINGTSLLGSGDIQISGGSGSSLWEAGTGVGSLMPLGGAADLSLQAGGNHSIALGSGSNASGDYSFAHSSGTASGDHSFAIESGIASGTNSIALGGNASGTGSGAVGLYSSASAQASLAIGLGTQATNAGESAYGTYNLSTTSATPADATHFSIGLGTQNSRRNEFEVKQNTNAYLIGVGGYDGTNASSALSLQSVINSKQNQLVSGVDIKTINGQSIVGGGDLVISGGGATYTAGTGISIDSNNVITNTAPDLGLWVKGSDATSIKSYNAGSNSGGHNSIAIGSGASTNANSRYGLALGFWSSAAGTECTAIGTNATSTGTDSASLGHYASSSNTSSLALGHLAKTSNADEIAIGVANNTISSGTTAEQTQFTIGNGTDRNARSNLIEAKKNNDIYVVGIGGFDGTNASSAQSLQTVINSKQDTLTAGTGISISGNVISATGGGSGSSYWVAGSGTGSIQSTLATNALGNNAVAVGYQASASGDGSVSLRGIAYGTDSMALGGNIQAGATGALAGPTGIINNNATYSVALGHNATIETGASNSIALGEGVVARMTNEYSIGMYNKYYNSSTASEKVLFSVGNGSDATSRSNAIEIKGNNDIYVVGIGGFDGTNSASAQTLQSVVGSGGSGSGLWTSGTGTDSLVAPATITAGLASNPAAGTGAISCGYDTNANGNYSFVSGAASSASGNYSFAANNGSADGDYSAAFNTSGASGNYSFAAGYGSSANAENSVALAGGTTTYDTSDPDNIINAMGSVAIGDGATASGQYSIAIKGTANGDNSIAIGGNTTATDAVAIGPGSSADGVGSVALCCGNATGSYSASIGCTTEADNSFAAGTGCTTTAGANGSIALGFQAITGGVADGEVALGKFNYSDSSEAFAFSVGCGEEIQHDPQDPDWTPNPDDPTSTDPWTEYKRKNAITIDASGNIFILGVGGYQGQSTAGATSLQDIINNI